MLRLWRSQFKAHMIKTYIQCLLAYVSSPATQSSYHELRDRIWMVSPKLSLLSIRIVRLMFGDVPGELSDSDGRVVYNGRQSYLRPTLTAELFTQLIESDILEGRS